MHKRPTSETNVSKNHIKEFSSDSCPQNRNFVSQKVNIYREKGFCLQFEFPQQYHSPHRQYSVPPRSQARFDQGWTSDQILSNIKQDRNIYGSNNRLILSEPGLLAVSRIESSNKNINRITPFQPTLIVQRRQKISLPMNTILKKKRKKKHCGIPLWLFIFCLVLALLIVIAATTAGVLTTMMRQSATSKKNLRYFLFKYFFPCFKASTITNMTSGTITSTTTTITSTTTSKNRVLQLFRQLMQNISLNNDICLLQHFMLVPNLTSHRIGIMAEMIYQVDFYTPSSVVVHGV